MIVAENLHKTFRSGFAWWTKHTPVLQGFDFRAEPGRITGVLGPNGAGKTTFFRILCGLEKPTSGRIEVDGMDPWVHPKDMRGRIALLPEEPGVGRHISGHDHLRMFGVMMGLRIPHINNLLEQANTLLHMEGFWARPFSTYSRGQKSRISLARMRLMPNASVLIFDEPSNGLDFEAVSRLHVFVRSLAQEGKTVLVASHVLADLRHLCDDMVGIADGRTASADTINAWMNAHLRAQHDMVQNTETSPTPNA